MTSLFFELVQLSIGVREKLSHEASLYEWKLMYEEAKKQALVGICFAGIERLPKEQHPPRDLLLQWFAVANQIQTRNELMNRRCKELQLMLAEGGIRSSILKGQSIARLYSDGKNIDLGLYRQSGDIDIWVDGEREDIIRYMREHFRCGRVLFHHIDVEAFSDVSVEVHFVPSFAYSWPRYRVYMKFFKEYKEECFASSKHGFCMPSLRFNMVYILLHIYRHVFQEGIGMRQLMDYYFVLCAGVGEYNTWATDWIRSMGLGKFTAAVMYVEREMFGLQKDCMLCEPDEKAGYFLLQGIVKSGNFGQYDPRIRDAHSGGTFRLYLKNVRRLFRMIRYYPSEVLWAPFWKVWHFMWMTKKN